MQILTTDNHQTPAFHLSVRNSEGKETDISTVISARLISLTLTDSRGFEADQLDIELDDSDGLFALPSRGAILSLGLGWKNSGLIYKGEYVVDEVSHSGPPDVITLRARSADLRGSLMNRHERSFHGKTLGEIVTLIAKENKLTPKISDSLASQTVAHLDQTNESSINLLSRLAQDYDAMATVKNGNLLFVEAGKGKTASGSSLPTFAIMRQSGDSHEFSIAEGDNYCAVKAYWHNDGTGKKGEVVIDENSEVKKQRMLRKQKATQSKQDELKTRTSNKKQATKSQSQYSNKYELVVVQHKPVESDSEKIKTLRRTYKTKQAALNGAQREFKKLQRGLATFSLKLALGNAELMPELPVLVSGFKAEIDSNDWIINKVTHNLDKSNGFTTALELELASEEIDTQSAETEEL